MCVGACHRAVAADHDQAIGAMVHELSARLLAVFGIEEALTPARAEQGSAVVGVVFDFPEWSESRSV